jgi:hypothetical protein
MLSFQGVLRHVLCTAAALLYCQLCAAQATLPFTWLLVFVVYYKVEEMSLILFSCVPGRRVRCSRSGRV